MIKFHDYNPEEPFAVEHEFHDIADGKVVLNYTPKEGTVKVKLDGVEATETTSSNPEAGQFYIDYAVSSDYRMATQQVIFNESDNGKRATFDYQGVSTLIRAEHFNEIRDFMNHYNEDRARTLVKGEAPPRKGESVENFAKPKLTNTLKIEVVGTVGTMITVDDVEGLEVGGVYTISDGEQYEEITVASINTTDKVVTAESLDNSYDKGWICVSTATMLNGKAFVSGDTQTIIWEPNETWRGNAGNIEKEFTLKTENATAERVTENELGELEVEDNMVSDVSILTAITPESYPNDYIKKYQFYNRPFIPYTTVSNTGILLDENLNPYPTFHMANYTPKIVVLFGNKEHTSSTLVGYFVPPVWAKEIEIYIENRKVNVVSLSLQQAEGYKLLSAFEKYPNGYYLMHNNYIPQLGGASDFAHATYSESSIGVLLGSSWLPRFPVINNYNYPYTGDSDPMTGKKETDPDLIPARKYQSNGTVTGWYFDMEQEALYPQVGGVNRLQFGGDGNKIYIPTPSMNIISMAVIGVNNYVATPEKMKELEGKYEVFIDEC